MDWSITGAASGADTMSFTFIPSRGSVAPITMPSSCLLRNGTTTREPGATLPVMPMGTR